MKEREIEDLYLHADIDKDTTKYTKLREMIIKRFRGLHSLDVQRLMDGKNNRLKTNKTYVVDELLCCVPALSTQASR